MKCTLFFMALLFLSLGAFSQVAINKDGSTANSSAMLDVKATNAGVLIPRMTAAQMDAIASPATGLMVFVTDDNKFYYYNGIEWINWVNASDNDWIVDTNALYSAMDSTLTVKNGKVGIGKIDPGAKLDVAGPIWETGTGKSLFFGEEAGANDDLSDNTNTFIGNYAGYDNTSGFFNTAMGYQALFSNTTGYENIAIGYEAMKNNTTGYENVAIGFYNLNANSTGYYNTALGNEALFYNTTGSFNTGLGNFALYNNSIGFYNTALGTYALYHNTGGNDNTAAGYYALYENTSGSYNSAFGMEALHHNTTGRYNTATGQYALLTNTTGQNNVAIGFNTLHSNTTGHENSALGRDAMYKNTTGYYNTAIGNAALFSNTNGYSNVAIGISSLYNSSYFNNLVAVGDSALFNNGNGALNIPDATANTAVGSKALYHNTTGFSNTATGYKALDSNTTGYKNTAYGYKTLYSNTTGYHNTAIGDSAFYNGTDYHNSTALGYHTVITASNQIRLGNSSVTSIGGYANWSNVSDKRFKKDVSENVPGLDFILKLRPVTYHLDMNAIARFNHTPYSLHLPDAAKTKGAMLQTGFIAQEVEQAAQSIGYDFSGVDAPKNENDYYGLRYAEFVVPLVKAVQEQQDKIEEQQKTIATLQNRLSEMETMKKEMKVLKHLIISDLKNK